MDNNHNSNIIRPLLILTGIVVILVKLSTFTDGDFYLFYRAGELLLHRQNPYQAAAYAGYSWHIYPHFPGTMLLMLLPSLLPLGFACALWPSILIVAWAGSVYCWINCLRGEKPDFALVIYGLLISLLPALIWCIMGHQLTILLLFFASLAVTYEQKGLSGRSGFFSGLLLMKPHLFLFFITGLFFRSFRKKIFLTGLLISFFLTFLPFLTGYRPCSDLKNWVSGLRYHADNLYCTDGQGIVPRLYSLTWPRTAKNNLAQRNRPTIEFPVSLIKPMENTVVAVFVLAFFCWLIFLKYSRLSLPWLAATALALGPLLSVYSHYYDGVLLIPWILATMFSGEWGLRGVLTIFFINLFLFYFLPFDLSFDKIHWTRTAFASTLYVGIGLLFLATGKFKSDQKT
jgi:hypothetical protein